ncbi:MAG: D-inositol-3-phosphate glycosyltransferase, partial [Cellulomonas sp.]|nr:D-inositol-3-phosphate glycosyltransferase [Cellulomonas sp.]
GGLRSIVDDGRSGRLVRGHDPAVWADVLAQALDDDDTLAAWGEAARPSAERFGWDAAADQVLKVYAVAAEAR